tara:strand:+ start:1216 stop:1650 length:435 start_codon:yes stop_codon:yes gene_type:complete
MRYLTIVIACLFLGLVYVGEASGDELKATPRKVIKPPATVRPQLPQGFGRPIQKPAGFGKQEWQKPQQPQQQQVRPSHNYRHGSIIIGRPYVHPFNYPSVETRFHPIHGFYRVYHPPVVNPYYNPQPFPVYPAPFHGFFFQFRW